MSNILKNIKSFMDYLTITDVLFFSLIVLILITLVVLLYFMKSNKEVEEDKESSFEINKTLNDIINNDEKLNIELTSYEEEQEENAIISYSELISSNNNKKIKYDDEFIPEDKDIKIQKIGVEPQKKDEGYQEQEDFLKQLKNLERNLS